MKRPFRSLRSLIHKPRAAILVWLGLPKGDGTLKLLRRMPCHLLNGQTAARLRRVLGQAHTRKWLQNLPGPLDPQVLGLLAFEHPVSFQILLAMVEESGLPLEDRLPGMSLHETFAEVERWLEQHDFPEDKSWLASIRSPARLRAWHDELAMRITTEGEMEIRAAWPAYFLSPLVPEPWIHPIGSFDDLKNEGYLMNHCVATRAPEIIRGLMYIYAIFHPVGRATLAISREKSPQHWKIEELRGPNNHAVPDQVREDIERWLERENPSRELPQGPGMKQLELVLQG